MKMKKIFLFIGLAGLLLNSCSDDLSNGNIKEKDNPAKTVPNTQEQYLVNFAGILSKATYERKDVREFLKSESLKQFDKNYDVLYYLVKDELIGEKSFRDILIDYSSKEIIEEIEASVPLLNILIPEIAVFDINPKDLDTGDNEIPVAVSLKTETSLFLDGKKELSLQKGEIPDFHVFVINENSRVIAPENGTQSLRSAGTKSVMFKSPNFDGNSDIPAETTMRASTMNLSAVGQKAIEAYNYFNKDDGSVYQKAFQRDYIYYGITPQKQSGNLNRSISEYISFIEVDPRAYFKIADQINPNAPNPSDDPYISQSQIVQEKREVSEAELLDRMWTKGAYDFRFEIITSTNQHPQVVFVPLKPNEIWDFNIDHTRVHPTMFRHSKNTYKIDPNKFTSKQINLSAYNISLGKWHLAEESIYRYVNIIEEDESVETTRTITYESTRVHSTKFNGDVKLEIGLGNSDKLTGGISGEVTNSNTIKDSKSVVIVRKEKSDDLGSIRIYYYDPIIEKISSSIIEKPYYVHSYNTGYVTFGIAVK